MAQPNSLLELVLDYRFFFDGAPFAHVKQSWWQKQLLGDLCWLNSTQKQIVLNGGRAHEVLSIVRYSAAFRDNGARALHRLKLMIYIWINDMIVNRIDFNKSLLWEVIPICHEGPITIKIKNGVLDEDGEDFTGTLADWRTHADGSGSLTLHERPGQVFDFMLNDLIPASLVVIENWDFSPWVTEKERPARQL